MPRGAITNYMDVAQMVLYAFWLFFFGLIFYLRREDKREGYPLWSEAPDTAPYLNFPPMPGPKTFTFHDGEVATIHGGRPDTRPIAAEPAESWPGAPLIPTGNPMLDGVGPAAHAERADLVELTFEGEDKIVPLRVAEGFFLDPRDPDPRGMEVLAADKLVAGCVTDVWVDRAEILIRYIEVELTTPVEPRRDFQAAEATTGKAPKRTAKGKAAAGAPAASVQAEPEASTMGGMTRVLLPSNCAKIDTRRRMVRVGAILASQFGDVPRTKSDAQITRLEEEMICAYYAGGLLYATPDRAEPLL